MDVIQKIQAFNAGRDAERLRIKYSKMRSGAFPFMRGSCHLFYERLPHESLFKSAPLTWLCGDLHLENFGSYKGDNRLVYFDVNDFDEAALGPASWDLIRVLTSLWMAADGVSIGHSDTRKLCAAFVQAYGQSLALGKAYWVERETSQGLVRKLLDGLGDRRRADFLDSRTYVKGKQRTLQLDGKKALPATETQRHAVGDFMARFAKAQPDPDFYQVLDVARRIAGTGSLGVDRFVILVRGKGSPDGNYLLDLKQAMASSLTPHLKVAQPAWETEAHRVVAAQRRLQAVSMAFLQPVLLGHDAYVLRGLQPSEDRVALGKTGQTLADWTLVLQTMGQLVAWAQLRSAGRDGSALTAELIDFAQDKTWTEHLLGAAEDCAQQVREDSATFNAAYDDGAFGK